MLVAKDESSIFQILSTPDNGKYLPTDIGKTTGLLHVYVTETFIIYYSNSFTLKVMVLKWQDIFWFSNVGSNMLNRARFGSIERNIIKKILTYLVGRFSEAYFYYYVSRGVFSTSFIDAPYKIGRDFLDILYKLILFLVNVKRRVKSTEMRVLIPNLLLIYFKCIHYTYRLFITFLTIKV